MPNQKATRVVTIDGKEVDLSTLPEFTAILEEVRKEEKDKLYTRIASLETQIKVLDDEKKSSGSLTKTQEDELKKLREELGAVKAEKDKIAAEKNSGKGDEGKEGKQGKEGDKNNGLSEEALAALLTKTLEKELAPLREQNKALTEKLQEVQSNVTRKTVDEYRREQVEKYKGQLIPELVPTGLSTQEEVNAAVKAALETSKSYLMREVDDEGGKKKMVSLAEYEAIQEKARKDAEFKQNPPTPPAKPEGDKAGDLGGKPLLDKVGELSEAEYEKHREQILREAAQVPYDAAG